MAMMNSPAHAADVWQPKVPPLATPWTHLVGPNNALPDYPRPQLSRARWQTLNGLWGYTGRPAAAAQATPPKTADFREQILVPFPTESALSGIQRHDEQMWYRKDFQVPADWNGQHVLLHFGAVDQIATVWVNNQKVAYHEGGYTEFSADISSALRPSGPQELTVRVEDRNETGAFAVGKQRNNPAGLFYTGASGIWQTVWMEPVPVTHIDKLDITPDLTSFTVTPKISGAARVRSEVTVYESTGRQVARVVGAPGERLRVHVPSPRLWTPDDPYLYDLKVRLLNSTGKVVDEVASYGGLRTIGTVDDAQGRPRIALNGKITFLHGPLDQGYWPDGIYTAPTDAALRFDLDQTKALGFNFVRKHAKVEPARWYYWTDRLGLLVWQDMPSLDVSLDIPTGPAPTPSAKAQRRFEKELSALIDQLRSVTSIVGWVPFNEGWGEYDTARIARAVKAEDPTRMVIPNSGANCCKSRGDSKAGDIFDDHTYVGPGRPVVRDKRAIVDGEYGGLGQVLEGNRWPGPPMAYEMTDSKARLTQRYVEVSVDLENVVRNNGLSAAVYTQTTDVENEVNGLMTYDRQLIKPDLPIVADRNRAVIAAGRQ
jgi:beta-galactosidase/beta-glucuronidase